MQMYLPLGVWVLTAKFYFANHPAGQCGDNQYGLDLIRTFVPRWWVMVGTVTVGSSYLREKIESIIFVLLA